MSAADAARLMRDTLAEALPAGTLFDCCPVADGGDDTLSVLAAADSGFVWEEAAVTGPVPGMTVPARVLVHAKAHMGVIEAAQAHGLKLLDHPSALEATSYGVGELMAHLLKTRPDLETLVVCLGGSASTDGGLGALQALGLPLLDRHGRRLDIPVSGGTLCEIAAIRPWENWQGVGSVRLVTDVLNPLLGPDGTARVFAPQKGATPAECRMLEAELARIADLMREAFGCDLSTLPGAGAAGGLAYGLRHLPRSGIVAGSPWIAGFLKLPERIASSDVILTGEGCFDMTSLSGKATGHLLMAAGDKPVFVFCGRVGPGVPDFQQVRLYPLSGSGVSPEMAMRDPRKYLAESLKRALPEILSALGG